MKRILLSSFALFAFFAVNSGFPQTFPILTVSGETYTNVTVTNVTVARATIFWDGGGKKILLSDLPPDLQRQLHYDPSAARALLQDESARAQAKKARALEAWRAANCRLLNGAIVETRTLQCLTGMVVTVARDGVLLSIPQTKWIRVPGRYLPVGDYNTNAEGGNFLFGHGGIGPERLVPVPAPPKSVFVQCPTAQLNPTQEVIFWVRRAGVYRETFEQYIATTPYVPNL